MTDAEIGALFERAARQAQRILGDRFTAEDVAGETLARIAAGADPTNAGLIVNGLAIDEYRRRGREIPYGLMNQDEPIDTDHLPRVQALTPRTSEFRTDFDRAVRALEDDERDALILTDLRGLSQREAADVLETSQPTVQRRAEAARDFIRKETAS